MFCRWNTIIRVFVDAAVAIAMVYYTYIVMNFVLKELVQTIIVLELLGLSYPHLSQPYFEIKTTP